MSAPPAPRSSLLTVPPGRMASVRGSRKRANSRRAQYRSSVPDGRLSRSEWHRFAGKRHLGTFTGKHFIRGCESKIPWPSRASARMEAKRRTKAYGELLEEDQCQGGCEMWHI